MRAKVENIKKKKKKGENCNYQESPTFSSLLNIMIRLEPIEEVVEVGDTLLETLALTDASDDGGALAASLERITRDDLPVVEHALREGLTLSLGTEIIVETEGLQHRQVSTDNAERSARTRLLSDDGTTTTVEASVDATDHALRALDLHKEDGLLKTRLSGKHASIVATTSSRNDLTTTTMDSIRVECDIVKVETNTTDVLIAHNTLLASPLESRDHGILDLIKVLDSLGHIDKDVGTLVLRTEAPDLTSISDIPAVVISHVTSTDLGILVDVELAALDVSSALLGERLSLHEETVVLVGRLGETHDAALGSDSLTEGNDGLGDLELGSAVLVTEILKADLKMELTSTSDDVLTRLFDVALAERIGLGKTLKTFDKLRKISRVLGLDSDTNDRANAELHVLDGECLLIVRDCSRLDKELIDTDKTNDITARAISDRLDETTHHKDSTLDGLDIEIVLLARDIVGTHDTDLLTSLDCAREDTTKGIETTLIRCGYHLRDVHKSGTVGIASLDSLGDAVVAGTSVEGIATITLGGKRRRKVDAHHLKESIGGREPLTHDGLEEGLAHLLTLVRLELDTDDAEHLVDGGIVAVHDSTDHLVDGGVDELAESTLEGGTVSGSGSGTPDLGLGIKVVITPESLHHLGFSNTKLGCIHLGKATEGESPLLETRTKGNSAVLRRNLEVTEGVITISGDDNVDGLDGTAEVLISLLGISLKLEKKTIDLVEKEDGLDTLTKSLTKNSLGLHTNTLDTIDDNKSTVSNTKSSSNLRAEVNVSGGVDKVDEETTTLALLGDGCVGLTLVVHGKSSGLDSDTTLLLIRTSIGVASITSLGTGNDTSLANDRVGHSGLTVIDVSNHRHVADVGLMVHHLADLVNSEVNHL